MTTIRLSLSKSARTNLKAIGREFDRCSRAYPALYHQRMLPWSEKGRVRITLSQWDAFRVAASGQLEAEEWSQWDEPSFDDDHLGLWLGDGEGLDEFVNLSESVAMVLSHEALDFDPLDFNLEVNEWSDWIDRLHSWAFKHQMPLLRSDMMLLGTEDHDPEDFYELAEQWETLDGGTSIPRHPVVWRLIDNVFTSAATAIRALLWPDAVITTDEPWPPSRVSVIFMSAIEEPAPDVTEVCVHADNPKSEDGESIRGGRLRHQLIEDELFWSLECAGSKRVFRFQPMKGFNYLSMFLRCPNKRFTPIEAYAAHGTKAKCFGGAATRFGENERKEAATLFPNSNALGSRVPVMDPEAERGIRMEYEQLLDEFTAIDRPEHENAEEAEELEKRLAQFKKQYVWDHDKEGTPRFFPKSDWEKPRKAVTNAINRSLEAIREKSQELAEQLDEQLDREKGFCFRPNPKFLGWEVVSRRSAD